MKEELEKELFDKYPKIFRQKDLSMEMTCMCWGVDTCDGWFDLIDTLCGQIQHHLDWANGEGKFSDRDCQEDSEPVPQLEATQVKEKFGGLRFYYDGGDEHIEGMVRLAETMSYKICELCGDKGAPQGSGWIITRCEKHGETRRWHTADG